MSACLSARSLLASSTASIAFSTAALAQCTPPITTNGPDVVVGDLTGPTNYASDATHDAFSMGTYSCNIGNNWLNWIASTNQHPVIGQNLYKMKTQANGVVTFEQIGQSWLKHGFYALSNILCCSGCSSTDGSHLGVHCSDPYSSSRNGSQSSLGPKYQVNAATGLFPYPPANPSWSTSTDRRLAAKLTDLEASSSTIRYFGSSIYICSSHTPSGGTDGQEPDVNRDNNESYRQVSYSGGNFGFIGSTVRGSPGIQAWADTVPGVTIKPVTLSPDQDGLDGSAASTNNHGLFIVAAKATNMNGSNLWHYEYAVQNLNSHRSGQSFSVPVPANVTILNIGFHDVDYRNGDGLGNSNRAATDWIATVANDAITWTTQTYAENPNANALRWDTLYNFRFDAYAAPIAGGARATIELFRPTILPTDPTSIAAGGVPAPGTPTFNIADLDHDGDVDTSDLAFLLTHYGACQGDAGYSDVADIADNNCIDIRDLTLMLSNFGL